jgi:hypothetical protein
MYAVLCAANCTTHCADEKALSRRFLEDCEPVRTCRIPDWPVSRRWLSAQILGMHQIGHFCSKMPRNLGDQEAGVRQPQTASHVCHDEYNCPIQISISRSRSKKDTTQVPDSALTAASRYMAALPGVGEGCMENWRWEEGSGKPELRRVRPWRASAEPACSKRSYWWSAELECGMRRSCHVLLFSRILLVDYNPTPSYHRPFLHRDNLAFAHIADTVNDILQHVPYLFPFSYHHIKRHCRR